MRKFVVSMAAFLIVLMVGMTALASSVTYIDRKELFEFKPGSEYQVTDLFENFKGVLPGDVLTEEIEVSNASKGKIRIFMQCKYDSYVETDAKDFLDKLTLKVVAKDDTIFEAAASEKAQLSEPVLLGTFKQKGKTTLTVSLEVPIELGNEYMNQIGVIPWTFIVEEIPDEDTPETGDWFRSGVWAAIAAAIAAVIIVLIFVQKKRREEN